jgi:UDP-N-acetylglucosamine 2-epimerase (non-hydrolysing)/GDP/UDP-N,N'-diacetylbacillosamine 2-epimerase (hydrolysing)
MTFRSLEKEHVSKRKIAVFTGNRAEYGLQFPILKAVAADPRLAYSLIAGVAAASSKASIGPGACNTV